MLILKLKITPEGMFGFCDKKVEAKYARSKLQDLLKSRGIYGSTVLV